jgi:hypothetical protein
MSFRVPDGMSRPTRSGSHVSTNLSMAVDEDGFFGRECPNADCLGYFKLAIDEYGMARERHRLTCPACGTTESDEHFFTSDQLERIRAAQIEFARGAVNDVFRDLGRRGTSQSGAVTIKWNTPPPYNPKPLPTYVERQTIRTFTCPNGGHRAVVYDLLAFCPYCGPDDTPPRAVFDDTMAAMARLLRVVTEQPPEARAELEAAGGSTVLAERALTIVIAAIQNLAKQIHIRAAKPKPSGKPQTVARVPEGIEEREGRDKTRSQRDGIEHFAQDFVEGAASDFDMDIGRHVDGGEFASEVSDPSSVELDEVVEELERLHVRASLVAQIGVEHQEWASGLAARVPTGTSKAIDEVQATVLPSHDRKPSVEIADQKPMFSVRVRLVVPEDVVRDCHRGALLRDVLSRAGGDSRDRGHRMIESSSGSVRRSNSRSPATDRASAEKPASEIAIHRHVASSDDERKVARPSTSERDTSR